MIIRKAHFYSFFLACCLGFMLSGCDNGSTFTVNGVVATASEQMLYLEHTGLSETVTLDSVKLKPNGKFSFKQPCPEYPDFYRLRMNNQLIHFSVDSTETVTFTADAHNFGTVYTVEGSENSKAFKEITLAQLDANQEIKKLREKHGMKLLPDSIYRKNIHQAIQSYKKVVEKYIFGAPMSAAAYFALFQKIDGLWFFDLYDIEDSKAYGAVATSYKAYYPGSPRAKQLEKLALQSIKITRQRRASLNMQNAKEVDFIDIELPDITGKTVKLSDIAKAKTTLVNFTAYQAEWSPVLNMKLNEIYREYKGKGFEIYQISLDGDAHFWKNAASNIPWVSVRDPLTIHSSVAAIYNVRQLPALFLLNKNGVMVKRIESIENIEPDISKFI